MATFISLVNFTQLFLCPKLARYEPVTTRYEPATF